MVDIKDDPDKLLILYRLANEQEQYFLKEHQSRIAFYTSFISILIGATLYGFTQINEWFHAIPLLVAPILIYVISSLAMHGSLRLYQRFVEAMMEKAKIEQRLELTKPGWTNVSISGAYWQNEALPSDRKLDARRKHQHSKMFYEVHKYEGYQKNAKWLFQIFQIMSVGLLMCLLLFSDWKHNMASYPSIWVIIACSISLIIPIIEKVAPWKIESKK